MKITGVSCHRWDYFKFLNIRLISRSTGKPQNNTERTKLQPNNPRAPDNLSDIWWGLHVAAPYGVHVLDNDCSRDFFGTPAAMVGHAYAGSRPPGLQCFDVKQLAVPTHDGDSRPLLLPGTPQHCHWRHLHSPESPVKLKNSITFSSFLVTQWSSHQLAY